jgi:CHAT domain-containing protein
MLHAVVVGGTSAPATGRRPAKVRPALRCLGRAEPLLADLSALRFAWRRLLTGHGSGSSLQAAMELATHAAEQLDQALLAPLQPLLADRPLVVVPTGALQSLPWPMLPSCRSRRVTIAPSASSWLAGRPEAAPGPPRHVVLIAGPGLPEAVAEVDSIAALYPRARVLAGRHATVASALRELEGASIAHIAAHGRFRADNPMFSSVMLADGPLTVYDLERLQRAPQTIMLAACDTARTLSHPGDEMTGLASGLLAAGASSVVAPLLPLPDDVATSISRGWHARLSAGQSPAQALAATAAVIARDGPLSRLAAASLVCLGHG